MLFSAIIERELRLSARNWRTYYSRVGVGLWALGLCLYLIWLVRIAAFAGGPAGPKILGACSILALALCCFNGINRTCDSISSEKREDTIGLLFLTHLTARDIVFGKLLAHGLKTAYLLAAITPILAIPIFLGGVTGGALIRVPLVLMNSLFLSLSIGLLVSTLAWLPKTAHGWAGMTASVLGFFLPVAAYLVQKYAYNPALILALNLPSPTYALLMSDQMSVGLSTNYFWTALAVQFVLAVGALAASCLLLPRCWRLRQTKPWAFKKWMALLAHGAGTTRIKRRLRMLGRNPLYWLSSRNRFAPAWPILFGVVTATIALSCISYFQVPSDAAFAIVFVTLALNDFAMRIRVGSLASLRLGSDRQSGALEMLLSTPMTVRAMISGVWMAIRHALLWAYVPLLLIYGVVLYLYLGFESYLQWGVGSFFVICSILDFVAMGYVSMWNAMRMRNVQQAAGQALLRVLILPWTIWAVIMPLAAQFPFEIGGVAGFVFAIVIWGVSTGTAIRTARRNLFDHFREAATDRYLFEEHTGFLRSVRSRFDNFLTYFLLRRRRPCVLN